MNLKRGEIYWTKINPTKGNEIRGKGADGQRPCVILSTDILNEKLSTVIAAPLTSTISNQPWRVRVFALKECEVMLEQSRCLTKSDDRFGEKIGKLSDGELNKCLRILRQIFS